MLISFFEKNKYLYLSLSICLAINCFFLFFSLENSWASDDYSYIFGTKLFNLVNNQFFFAFETDAFRLRYLFWFIVQFIPENYLTWKIIILLFYLASAVLIFQVSQKLTQNLNISLLASILFTLNYSISIKALSWGVFYGHILNIFLGLIGTLILIKIIKNISITNVLLFLLINISNFLITEGAAIYLIINLVIIFFYKNIITEKIKLIIVNFLPIIFYFILSLLNTGQFNKVFTDRLMDSKKNHYFEIFSNEKDSENFHYYRSTYAPRDLKGLSIRLVDNILGALNLSSIENYVSFIDKNKKIKTIIKSNIYKIVFLFFTSVSIILIYLYYSFKNKMIFKSYIFYVTLFLSTLMIYSLIYHRKDINLGLSFSSALLLSKIIIDLNDEGKKIISRIMLLIFIIPTILYASSGFSIYSQFNSNENFRVFNEYKSRSSKIYKNNEITKDVNFKIYYYYKNYPRFQNEFKNLNKNKLLPFLADIHNM